MSVTKRKKVRRYRGSKTHGGGSMKKRRGAGSRGGRGRAGSGKRGDVKKPSYWKEKGFGQGERGFSSKSRSVAAAISVAAVERRIDALISHGALGKDVALDLSQLGFTKLLGSGQVRRVLHITVHKATAAAIEKVEAAGGSVTVLDRPSEDAE